ncbi:tetratricopeptide repeat-containing sensor histidine kinase [Catalinimonas niigatensis]|uniref:tetratricopeptide repeat-containing sensor histidine kinase n=1 Tax=Catalinimonas niigatensis TaxID=1397264 RepID=UPI002665078C|nr:tetratricopeptide repeat-containing sensor histidine kinase [Catalinimonas niigatensis]WPP50800.1 tetratricopeptide repeat-containing sensor histidine kinase [Catalinimonas niigatensis]
MIAEQNPYLNEGYSHDLTDTISSLLLKSLEGSEPSESLEYAMEAMKRAEYIDDSAQLAEAYYSVGSSYDMLGEDQLAIKYFQLALKEYEDLDDSLNVSWTLNNLGVVYDELGDYDEALSYYLLSLEALGEGEYPENRVTLYNNIGLIYEANGLTDKALENLYSAYRLALKYDLQGRITYPLHSLGETYLNHGEYDSALHYFLQSYQVDDELEDQMGLAINLQSMGKAYLLQKKYKKAEAHLKEALEIQTKIGDKYEQTCTLTLLGKLYFQMKNYEQALEYTGRALKFAEKSNTKNQIKEAAEVLSNIYRDFGNFEKALFYTDLSNTYKDSIYNEAKSRHLALLQLNKQEAENAALMTDNEFKSAILDDQQVLIEKQTYVVIFISLGLVLSFIILSLLMNSNKDKNLANQRLIKQKQEIEKIIKELTTLNENVNRQKDDLQRSNQIKDKLLSIISHDFRSPLNSLEGILDLMTQGRISPDEMQMISKELRLKVNITTNLLDNLLNWAKSQMQGINPNPEFFDIKNLVEDTIHLLSTQAEKKDVRIYNRIVHSQNVFSDYEMTKLVVRNLVSNAIKFTSSGDKIFVKAGLENGFLQFVVKDTGKGIIQEEKSKLFTHESKSTLGTAYEKGTGLGLLLCKDFVEKNGGNITVESEEGEGSTFCFTIPIEPSVIELMEIKE